MCPNPNVGVLKKKKKKRKSGQIDMNTGKMCSGGGDRGLEPPEPGSGRGGGTCLEASEGERPVSTWTQLSSLRD